MYYWKYKTALLYGTALRDPYDDQITTVLFQLQLFQ